MAFETTALRKSLAVLHSKMMSNRDYWTKKITRNRERDQLNQTLLSAQGWDVYIAWECRIKSPELEDELRAFLASHVDVI